MVVGFTVANSRASSQGQRLIALLLYVKDRLVVAPEHGRDGALVLEDLEDVGDAFNGDVVDY
jgi:hypothetical protein